jgi:nitronate monooxygenase
MRPRAGSLIPVSKNEIEIMKLQSLLGIELPIVQAPMAGVQGQDLALAVSEAGGLGSLPCAGLSTATMRKEMLAIRQRTSRPFNANFFCHPSPAPRGPRELSWQAALSPYYREYGIDPEAIPVNDGLIPFNDEAVRVVEEVKPPVVSFHFGLPAPELLARVKETGARVLCTATNLAEAKWLEAQGTDAIIAQGLEAGGHRGNFLSDDLGEHAETFDLLASLKEEITLPIIAAGGIASPEAVASAIESGAAGVQIGTTYLLCPEAKTSALHREALKSPRSRNTVVTRIFSGRPARAIVNRAIRELDGHSVAPPPFPLGFGAIAPLRAKSEAQGSSDFSALWAGRDTSGCNEIPAGDLTRALAANLT